MSLAIHFPKALSGAFFSGFGVGAGVGLDDGRGFPAARQRPAEHRSRQACVAMGGSTATTCAEIELLFTD